MTRTCQSRISLFSFLTTLMPTSSSPSTSQQPEAIELADRSSIPRPIENARRSPIPESRQSAQLGGTVRISDDSIAREDGIALTASDNEFETSLPPVDGGFGAWSFVGHPSTFISRRDIKAMYLHSYLLLLWSRLSHGVYRMRSECS
jgi:hypothetical protein